MLARTKKLGLALGMLFACNVLAQALVGFTSMEPAGSIASPGSTTFNDKTTEGSPEASDTVIVKDWEAVETLTTWWDATWDSRRKVTFTEPGLMDRDREPTTIDMTFAGDEARVNSIRLTFFRNDSTWVEVPSQIFGAVTHLNGSGAAFYTSCSVFFFLNMTKDDTEVYYVYYDPVINTAPAYADLIDVRGLATTAITDDTVNPSFTHLNGTAYNNVDSLQIAVNDNWAAPQAAVALVDTIRSGSDWGGPACSIYSALYGGTDTLNIGRRVYMSVGEMALQASSAADPFGTAERINVGPDNPQEAWDGLGAIRVLDDGPLFTRIQIQTTDGAYAALATLGSTSSTGWYRDAIYGTATDSVNRGTSGGNGYVKYNITYTFYYYGQQTFAKIDLDILAAPQRGPVGSGYPREASNYLRPTNVNFKNYGDWPHLMQLVDGNGGTTTPLDRKSWIGSKYSPDGVTVYNMPIADRRRDYPLEPWTAWYASTGTTNPTIGMMAVTNSIGWEVTSLAVSGIGYNSLLQQILPEGHQGDIFTLQRGSVLNYEYYMLTSAGGTNWTAQQDMCKRMNDRVSVAVSSAELFSQNSMFIHTDDLDGNLLLGTRVRLYDSVNALVRDELVDSNGNATFLGLVDGTYTVRVSFYTPNLLNEYVVMSETLALDHLIPAQRIVFRDYNCSVARLAFDVVNWARDDEALTGVQIRIRNATTAAIVEQNFTWGGFVDFHLYTTGVTQYGLEFVYGGQSRVANVTSPYTLAGNTNLSVGLAIDTTAITIAAQNSSITVGQTYQVAFYYHLSGNTTARYNPSSVTVSTQFDSDYWTPGTDYSWSVSSGPLITLSLLSGAGTRLVNSGLYSAYVHAANSTVETATEKVFIVVNPVGSSLKLTLNDTASSSIQVSRGEQVLLEVDYIDSQTSGDILGATVNYTLSAMTTGVIYNAGSGNYSTTIGTSTLPFGTYVVTVQAWRQNYDLAITSFVIIVYARPASVALSSQGNSFFGENFTIEIDLTDGINASDINSLPARFDANIKETGAWGNVTGSNGQYTATFAGSDFTSLGTYTVQVNWTAPDSIPYYQSVKSSILVRVVQRDSLVTYDPVGNVAFGEVVQVNLRYEDGINGTGISSHTNITSIGVNATVENLGSGVYRASFNTGDLGSTTGTYYANISLVYNQSFSPYYESHWANVKVVVVNRPTQLIADAPAAVEYGQNATFSVYFTDLLNGSRLYGSGMVSITSGNTTIGAVLNVDKYDVSVNSTFFGATGVYYVPITATWTGGSPYYANNNVLVKVTVVQRSSQVSYDSLAPTPYMDNFTFFVNFNDGINGNPISGATISANLTNPTHITWSPVSPGRYAVSINTTEISAGLGDNFLLVTVAAPGGTPFYAGGQIVLRLTTTDRPTVLSYSGLQPTPLNVDVVFTITFRDAQLGTGIFNSVSVTSPTANISLTPAPVNQMNGNYLITIHDAGLLTVGSHVVVFNFDAPALAPYYRDNSISITVEITARPTQIVYAGLVPTSYGESFDFTVQVQDALQPSVLIQGLVAGDFDWNASYTFVGETSGNYRFRIGTTQYGAIGTVKYQINASLTGNYASSYAIIPFTVVNRAVALSQGSLLPVSFGEDVVFEVTYADGINSTGLVGRETYLTTVPAFSNRQEVGSGAYRFTVAASNFAALGSYSVQVNSVWPGGIPPYYAAANITVPVSIVPRGAGLTADKESNVQFGENMTINISFQDTVNSSYINLPLAQLLVSVVGFSNVTIVKTGASGIYQARISTLQLPTTGTYTVSVSTVWTGSPYYYNVSRTVSVVVSQRNAMLYPGGEIYQPRGYNVLFNVSLYYIDVVNGSTITRVSDVLRNVSAKDHLGSPIPAVNSSGTVIGYSANTGWYATFNSSHFGNPSNYAYVVTMQFNWSSSAKPFYLNRVITFNITVDEARTQVIVVAGSFVAMSGQNHTLTFQYINSESGQTISGATVSVNDTQAPILYGGSLIWNGTAVPSGGGVNYTVSFNVTALPESLHLFNITFSLTNFNTVTYVFTLVDTSLASELVTDSIQPNRVLGQAVSILLAYRYQGSTNPIPNAVLNVSSNVSSVFWAPAEYSVSYNAGKYNLTILNTGESALRINSSGFHQIYVTMYSNTTESRTINVQFELLQIPTNITRVYFNGTRYVNALPSYSTQITKDVNITVDFVRLFPAAANITTGATVFVTSSSLSSSQYFSPSGTQYRLILPAAALGVGTHFLFVIGQRTNHQQSTKSIQIVVTQVSTNLTLFLNGTSNSSIQVKYGQAINVSALYQNTVDNVYITDLATTVTLTGGSGGTTSWSLTVMGAYWRCLLDSKLLGPPASYTMTLSASRANYTTSSKVFTIQVVEIPTTLAGINASSLTVNWSATFMIYVSYQDYLGVPVPSASVTSSPFANSTGGFNGTHYWLGYNSSSFGPPNIYNLVITATRTNSTSQSISFSIDVRPIPTSLATYSGATPATYFIVLWGDDVDVIARYRDVLHASAIEGASISAGSKNGSIISAIYAAGEYTLRFNSTLLGAPGVYIVSLTFSKANHDLKASAITIQVAGPQTQLIVSDMSGSPSGSFNLVYGQSLSFMVRMRDANHSVDLNSWSINANPNSTSRSFSFPNWTMTYDGLTPGIYTISITGQKENYTLASALVTVIVDQVATRLYSFASSGGMQSAFSMQWGATISVVVQYQVFPTGVPIDPNLITVTTTSFDKLSGVPTKDAQNTTFVFDGTRFVPGVYTIIFEANRSHYDDATASITLTISSMNTTLNIVDIATGLPSFSFVATWGASVEFDVSYNQTASTNAFATIPGVVSVSPNSTARTSSPVVGLLRLTYDTVLFSPGIYSITVTATYQNRTARSAIVSLTINPVSTSISAFNSANANTTSFDVYWNETLQISVVYQAGPMNITQDPGTIITTTLPAVQANGIYGRVNLTFSTVSLSTQIYQVTITAGLANYTAASISVLINVQQRPTTAMVYAAGGSEQYSFSAYWGDDLLVDVLYTDTLSASNISNVVGTSITSVPVFTSNISNGQYRRLQYATAALSPGLYSIVISCTRSNHASAQQVILLNVLSIPTLTVTYNVTSGASSSTFKAKWNAVFQISVQYNRTGPVAGVTAATAIASVPWVAVNEAPLGSGRYVFTFNSTHIGSPGIYAITFTANKTNYVTGAASVTLEVIRVNAVLQSYVSGGGLQSQFSVEWGTLLTFTARYHLVASPYTGLHPTSVAPTGFPNASITLGTIGNGENITMSINSSWFGGTGIFTATFIMSRTNYTESSMLVTIQVLALETRVNLLVNSTVAPAFTNITASRQYYVPFENDITIRVQYLTQAGSTPIGGARVMVRFIERGMNWTNYPGPNNLIVNQTGGYYDLTLDTLTDLGDYGQYSFVVVVSKQNHTLESEPFYVYPLKKQTRLDIFSSTWQNVTNGQLFTVNYTGSLVLYAAFYDLSKASYINQTYNITYLATVKGRTYLPVMNFTNGTVMFLFNTSVMDVDVGTSNFVSFTASAGIYNPSGASVNLEVETVPTSLSMFSATGSPIPAGSTISVNYTQTFTLLAVFTDVLNNKNITGLMAGATIVARIYTYPVAASYIGGGRWSLFFDSLMLPASAGSTPQVIVQATYQNFTTASFSFNLAILEVPTTLTAFIYNTNQSLWQQIVSSAEVNWSDTFEIAVYYNSTLTGSSVKVGFSEPTIKATFGIPSRTEPGTFPISDWGYIAINSSLLRGGNTHTIIVTGNMTNYTSAEFRFNLVVLEVPTRIYVQNGSEYITNGDTLQVYWSDMLRLNVTYQNLIDGLNITTSEATIRAVVFGTTINATSIGGGLWSIDINTSLIAGLNAGSTPQVLVSARLLNYSQADFSFNLQVLYLPTVLEVFINGYVGPDLNFTSSPSLLETLNFTARYLRLRDMAPIGNADNLTSVHVEFKNDTNPAGLQPRYTLVWTGTHYTCEFPLEFDTFHFYDDIAKKFAVEATRPNYETGYNLTSVYIKPITVVLLQNRIGDTSRNSTQNLPVEPGSRITFEVQLINNYTGAVFLEMMDRITVTAHSVDLFSSSGGSVPMDYIGNGTFRCEILFPAANKVDYTVRVRITIPEELRDHYQIPVDAYYSFYAEQKGQGFPEWLFWIIFIALIVVVTYFVLYQIRFKYPPIIRKIHDLSGAVRRGKAAAKIPVQRVTSREEGIYSEFAKLLNEYSFLQTHAKTMAAQAKKAKQKGYVAPEAKDTLAKDFDLTVKEKIVEVKSVAPAIFPKEGPKKVVVGPPKAEYVEPETPATAVPTAPAGPGMPSIPKIPAPGEAPGLAAPVSVAALPKPAAKPLPAKPAVAPSGGEGQEGLYGELVKLEQKKYKAQRSLRDLKAKKEKGILSDEEYEQYRVKFEEALEKINEKIGDIRRKLVNF
ncbi:MAG: hypothetical protein JW839_05815 [Candidatus Lokiarchaeota archaeon]|nr:hypothetical protein [Candidatus Lokiarchaeota archaeon]